MFFFFFPILAHALSFEVIGPCKAEAEYQGEYALVGESNVGQASLAIFESRGIPYIGSELGFNSIMNTPVDRDAIEFPAPDEIRAYGWCYEVDGRQPEGMPNEVALKGSEHLRWFYAFGLYKAGKWVSYCTPAHTVKPAKLCP